MKIILVILLMWTFISNAGPKVIGNGGDGVVCRDSSGKITSVEILDYFEGRNLYQYTPVFNKSLSVENIVFQILQRLKERDLKFYELLIDGLKDFNSEARFLSNIRLEDTNDSKHLFSQKGCKVEQLAIQYEPQLQEKPQFLIDKDLWDIMPALSKVGLILHEILYRQYILNQVTDEEVDSRMVRRFNALLAADEIKNLSDIEYKKYAVYFRPENFVGELKGKTLRRTYMAGGIPRTEDQTFTLDGQIQNSLTCHMSRINRKSDLKSEVSVEAKINMGFIEIKSDKKNRNYSQDKIEHCEASIVGKKVKYDFLSASQVLMDGIAWDVVADNEAHGLALPVQISHKHFLNKKWGQSVQSELGQIDLIEDLSEIGKIKVTSTCHFSDGIVTASAEAPVELTATKIIYPESKITKVISKSGMNFCIAMIEKKEINFEKINENQVYVFDDLPGSPRSIKTLVEP